MALQTPPFHRPVMLKEVLLALAPMEGGIYFDGTFGAGGYSRGILEAARGSRVIAVDRDPRAVARGADLAGDFPGRFAILNGLFSGIGTHLDAAGSPEANGVVLDVGVSSMQIDDPERGFSFQKDGPLDMRMGEEGPTAADAVNTLSEEQLAHVLSTYGEEKRARAIARAIVRAREEKRLERTSELSRVVQSVLGRRPQDKVHPSTRTFQALRIHVNDELGELARCLVEAEKVLKPGGRLAVVTFHSLEDRIVKRFLAERSGRGTGHSRHQPAAEEPPPPSFTILKPFPATPGDEETSSNPRARSAKLRAAERTGAPAHGGAPDLHVAPLREHR